MKTQYNRKARLYAFLFLITGICLTMKAQHAFYVYQHNGTVNSFFYADCDSITYAQISSKTNPQVTEFVQVIHTADSVFRIPVNEIDSVSFYKPETVYQPGVIKLEEKLFPYIIKHDSLTLVLDSKIPTELLPKQGDKLVTLEMNETFPSGFTGKVIEVSRSADNYLVRCELPLLTDIFSVYYYEGCFDLQSAEADEAEEQATTRAFGDIVWPPVDRQFTLPDARMTLNAGTLGLISGPFSGSVSQTISYTLKSKMRLRTSLQVNNGVHFHLTMTGEHALTTNISASVAGSVNIEPDITVPVPIAVAPSLAFYLTTGAFVEVSGSFNGEYNQTHYFTTAVHYEYDHGSPSNIPAQIKLTPKGQNDPKGDFMGNVSFKFGIFAEMGVAVASKEIAKAGIAYKEGTAIDIRMDLGGPAISSPPNTSVYDKYKENDVLTIYDYRGYEFRLQALYAQASIGIEATLGDPFLQIGVVPNFDNVKAGMSESNIGELYATADVSGRCFGKHRVGFALYHEDKLLSKAYYNTSYDGKNPLTISHIFKGLTPGKKYTVYPIVELFGNSELLATPSSEAEPKVSVLTGESSYITTQSATLSGTIEGINSTISCEYGISYQKAGDSKWIDIPSSEKGGGTFSTIINGLSPDTNYSYRAYLRTNGQVIYGTTRSFRTEKETETYEAITEEVSNLTSSSAILAGTVKGIEASMPCEYGIAYKEHNNQYWTEVLATNYNSNGYFTCNISELTSNTEYEYRAFLRVDNKEFFGTTQLFITNGTDLDSSILSVLQEFYESTNGNGWYNHQNWLKGSDLLSWYGFSPSYVDEELYDLKLNSNNLTGNAMLRNSNFIASMSLEDNAIRSLTMEHCEGLSELTLPGQGETLRIISCGRESRVSDSSPESLKIDTKERGRIESIEISQSTYSNVYVAGYLSNRNINVNLLDYTGANQNFRGYLRGGLNATIGTLNVSHIYDAFTISFNEIETLNISEVYPSKKDYIDGRWDIGDGHTDGHIENVNVDQSNKLPFPISFYQHIGVANIRNMVQPTSGIVNGHIFFRFEKGVNEVNISNLQLQNSMFSVWTPNPIVINITDSSFLLSDFSVPSADNVFNIVNCDVSMMDVDNETKNKYNVTFRGTMSQLLEYLKTEDN